MAVVVLVVLVVRGGLKFPVNERWKSLICIQCWPCLTVISALWSDWIQQDNFSQLISVSTQFTMNSKPSLCSLKYSALEHISALSLVPA